MALSNNEIQLIRSSFRAVLLNSDNVADHFYRNLFEYAPETRALFTTDISRQGDMLMSKLSVIVLELHNMDTLAPMLEGLALRHVAYGVKREHYPVAGAVLLQTFEELLGDRFTPETRRAWEKAYGEMAELMTTTAYAV